MEVAWRAYFVSLHGIARSRENLQREIVRILIVRIIDNEMCEFQLDGTVFCKRQGLLTGNYRWAIGRCDFHLQFVSIAVRLSIVDTNLGLERAREIPRRRDRGAGHLVVCT